MKLVAYLGGPRVRPGDFYWCYRRGHCVEGLCGAAVRAGADIPADTYLEADPQVSAFECVTAYDRVVVGANPTAILPLEVTE